MGLAGAFREVGHAVTWWTSDWGHANKVRRGPEQFVGYPWQVEVVPTLPYHRNTGARRCRSHARFARDWLVIPPFSSHTSGPPLSALRSSLP